jgi:hypothetical protein
MSMKKNTSYSSLVTYWFSLSQGQLMAADVLACKFSPSPYRSCPFCTWFALLAVCFILVSCLSYSLILMMEAIHSSKTLAYFHKTTQHFIPEAKFFIVTTMRISNTTLLHFSTKTREETELMVRHYNPSSS